MFLTWEERDPFETPLEIKDWTHSSCVWEPKGKSSDPNSILFNPLCHVAPSKQSYDTLDAGEYVQTKWPAVT